MTLNDSLDVAIVGAGPAGVGMAMELRNISGLKYAVLESKRIGESFRCWPNQTRFITPSFNSNPFGLADLNAIDAASSPAIFAGVEHLSGIQYADYLNFIVDSAELPVSCGVKVIQVHPKQSGGFCLITNQGEINTRFLIWACGEYQFPDLTPFPGAQWCTHYAQIEDWKTFQGNHCTVIGGYESGIDASYNLIKLGCHVRLLIRRRIWDIPDIYDPSQMLSPYTRERLREIENNDALEIISDVNVIKVTAETAKDFRIHAANGKTWDTVSSPILGTGFQSGGGARQIANLWEWNEKCHIKLSTLDESIRTPGLFLIGPHVRQEQRIYCFIYKFRQRFTAIAEEISQRLEVTSIPIRESISTWGPFGNSDCREDCEC